MSSLVEDFGAPYAVTRYTAGSRLDGSWVPGGIAPGWPQTLTLSIQPAKPSEILMMPEGQRQLSWIRIYTDTELLMTNEITQIKGDKVEYNGKLYEVQKVDTYPVETDMPHSKCFAVWDKRDNLGDS